MPEEPIDYDGWESEPTSRGNELRAVGWILNAYGWWHPPSGIESRPIDEAYNIMKADKQMQ